MDASQIGPIILAVTALITALTTLIALFRVAPVVRQIHANTNSTLEKLTAKADTATEQRATAAELEARPRLITPKIP